MQHSLLLLVLLGQYLLVVPAHAAVPAEDADIIGSAHDANSGQLLYLEHHYCDEEKLVCSVFFLRPTGDIIASKVLDYRKSAQAPTLSFYDYRFNKALNLTPTDTNWVVDSGFDNFLRSQWPALSGGQDISFSLHLLGRDSPLDMLARPRPGEDCTDAHYCIDVVLDSWLLGKLVAPIQLTYDKQQRTLLRFKGLSNLPADDGEKQWVDIHYQYQTLSE